MSKFTSKVTSTNTLPQLLKKLESLDMWEAEAGFDDRDHPESGTPLWVVARTNEFGEGVMERPFMSNAFAYTMANKKSLVKALQTVIYGKATAKGMYMDIAEDMAQTIRDIIDEGNFVVTNNPTPLIDSGFLRSNVLAGVVKKR